MLGMGWSWADLQATPGYVQAYCRDLLELRRAAENEAQKRAAKG